MKACPKCQVLISDPKANYCKVHRGKNPLMSKDYEDALIRLLKKCKPAAK